MVGIEQQGDIHTRTVDSRANLSLQSKYLFQAEKGGAYSIPLCSHPGRGLTLLFLGL